MLQAIITLIQVLQGVSCITRCDRLLLQSASGITNCGSYYKVKRNSVNQNKWRIHNIYILSMGVKNASLV